MALFYVDWDVVSGSIGTPAERKTRYDRTRELLTAAVQTQAKARFEKLGSTTLLWQADAADPTAVTLHRDIESAFTRSKTAGVTYDPFKLIVLRVGSGFKHSGFTTAEASQLEAVRAKET